VGAFVLFHLRDDGAGFRVLRREALQVAIQMRFDLAFGLGQKAQVPARAEPARGIAQGERSGVPERIEQARAPFQLAHALRAPGEVILFLARRARQRRAVGLGARGERLPPVERLRADFSNMVHPHQGGRIRPLGVREPRIGGAGIGKRARRPMDAGDAAQRRVEFPDRAVENAHDSDHSRAFKAPPAFGRDRAPPRAAPAHGRKTPCSQGIFRFAIPAI